MAQTPSQNVQEKVEELLEKVDTVIAQQEKLAKNEKIILEQVVVEEKEGEEVEQEVEKVEEVSLLQKNLIIHAKHHRLLFPLIVGVGVVLLWRGLWNLFDQIPIVSYSFISIALGIIILWAFNRLNSI
ncbi:MAG TPA: hypothetical protein VN711_04420 [Candidatus Saccharimonadales bacterium]|nr:hypothetical protein [Candidatus Saccharimonadales bacterium]